MWLVTAAVPNIVRRTKGVTIVSLPDMKLMLRELRESSIKQISPEIACPCVVATSKGTLLFCSQCMMQVDHFSVPVPAGFSLAQAVCSYGFFTQAPNAWKWQVSIVLLLGSKFRLSILR